MTRFNGKIRINASKNEVWNIIANLGAIQNFHPGVSKSYYSSDQQGGVGASRVCELIPMGVLEEKAIEWKDGESFILDVVPIEKAPPFKNASGGFTLEADGDETVVHFQVEYDLKFGLIGKLMDRMMVKPQFEKVIPGVLEGLKHYVETDEEVTPQVLKRIRKEAAQAPLYA